MTLLLHQSCNALQEISNVRDTFHQSTSVQHNNQVLLNMLVDNIFAKPEVLAQNVFFLTFTESGATAIRERLSEIIGRDAYKVAIHTFHSFGSEVINRYSEYFYHGADFRPADELASYEIVKGIFDGLDYNNPLASKLDGEYVHIRDTLQAI